MRNNLAVVGIAALIVAWILVLVYTKIRQLQHEKFMEQPREEQSHRPANALMFCLDCEGATPVSREGVCLKCGSAQTFRRGAILQMSRDIQYQRGRDAAMQFLGPNYFRALKNSLVKPIRTIARSSDAASPARLRAAR